MKGLERLESICVYIALTALVAGILYEAGMVAGTGDSFTLMLFRTVPFAEIGLYVLAPIAGLLLILQALQLDE